MVSKVFATEVDLVRAYCEASARDRRDPDTWTPYHETAGFDLLMVHRSGIQVGIEAKLGLNAKVLEQGLPKYAYEATGPDYRAVLVPQDGLQLHLRKLAEAIGLVVITVRPVEFGFKPGRYFRCDPDLPDETWAWSSRDWPNWCPEQRCRLPEYVPDVIGGSSAPVQLSEWKIKAIKLLILLERNGAVRRADMKVLGISPTRWTDHWNGFLSPGQGGYVPNGRTPDLRAQHPEAWVRIEADFADFADWAKGLSMPALIRGAA